MSSNIVQLVRDTFSSVVSGFMGDRDKLASLVPVINELTPQDLEALWRGDWIARKIVSIPAVDATRMWRDWKADKLQIEKIEEAERDLQVRQKVLEALLTSRLYGGAAIIIGVDDGQDTTKELKLDRVRKDSIKWLHVAAQHQLNVGEVERDVQSRWYGQPKWYAARMATPGEQEIRVHPSRIMRFIGSDFLADMSVQQMRWGDSVLQPVESALRAAGGSLQSLGHLVQESTVNVIKVPRLQEIFETKESETKFIERLKNVNRLKSVINTILLDEKEGWERVTIPFTGLPEVLQMFLLVVCAAADITAVRFMEQSPKGLNATGESDIRTHYDRIKADQEQRMTPAMSLFDECLIRHALGSRPKEIWFEWASLWQMDEKQEVEILNTLADAAKKLSDSGLVQTAALAKGLQNKLVETGSLPGLDDAIAEAEAEGDFIEDPEELAPEEEMGLRVEEERQMRELPPPKGEKTKVKNT